MHMFFGLILAYLAYQSAMFNSDEEIDFSKNVLVRATSNCIRVVPIYDKDSSFFVSLPVDERGNPLLPNTAYTSQNAHQSAMRGTIAVDLERKKDYKTIDLTVEDRGTINFPKKYFATLLFIVVIALQVADILFAFDSTTAVVAQTRDGFIAITATAFAMLGLRSSFFILDALLNIFQ